MNIGAEPSGDRDLVLEGVAHDLNNVFESISEAAALIGSDPEWAATAATIERSLERGRRVAACLTRSVEPAGDLAQAISNAVEFARDYFGSSVRFKTSVQPGLVAPGPPAEWERALFNLLLNSGEAMDRRGVIEIAARRFGDTIQIGVADDGPGIPEDILPHIFEPHFSTKPDRSGMGLHIVASIVARYGGTISVGNRAPGPGAIFELRLPA